MSREFLAPGVFVDELAAAPRTIEPASTSRAAFVGRARRGPLDTPTLVTNFAEFELGFGGLWRASSLSYAVQHFFLNGGREALIVRVACGARRARLELGGGTVLEALSPGAWGRALTAAVRHGPNALEFELEVSDGMSLELFARVSMNAESPHFVGLELERSRLVRVGALGPDRPPESKKLPSALGSASDGSTLRPGDLVGPRAKQRQRGLFALDKAEHFQVLCIPPLTRSRDDNGIELWSAAAKLCAERRALLVVDAPASWTPEHAAYGIDEFHGLVRANAALYFPRIQAPDPLAGGRVASFAPCGAVAGVIARTDAARGVWKAPAGTEAALSGVVGLAHALDDARIGELQRLGVNCLRSTAPLGPVVWGARTLDGADQFSSEWKYVPVRRLALFLEASIVRGALWAVFEPNGEALWAALRGAIENFMLAQFSAGAFQGVKPEDAYFVRCDASLQTRHDLETGHVSVLVGFAPLKPAEFVVLSFVLRSADAD